MTLPVLEFTRCAEAGAFQSMARLRRRRRHDMVELGQGEEADVSLPVPGVVPPLDEPGDCRQADQHVALEAVGWGAASCAWVSSLCDHEVTERELHDGRPLYPRGAQPPTSARGGFWVSPGKACVIVDVGGRPVVWVISPPLSAGCEAPRVWWRRVLACTLSDGGGGGRPLGDYSRPARATGTVMVPPILGHGVATQGRGTSAPAQTGIRRQRRGSRARGMTSNP